MGYWRVDARATLADVAAALLIACVFVFVGCGESPRYCAECREIRQILAKVGKTLADVERVEALERELDKRDGSAAALRRVKGLRGSAGHTGCDCPCHFTACP